MLGKGIIEGLTRLARVNPAALFKVFKQLEIPGPRLSPPLVLRLDGVGFSKVLPKAGYAQPRDERVHAALVSVADALIRRFSGASAYVVSDEVSVLLDSYVPYGGRLFKVVSVSASLASSVLAEKLGHVLIMDSRPVILPSLNMWGAYVLWRSRVAANNFVSRLYHIVKEEALTPPFDHMLRDVAKHITGKEVWEVLGSCLTYEVVEEVGINPVTYGSVKKRRRLLKRYDGPWRCLR